MLIFVHNNSHGATQVMTVEQRDQGCDTNRLIPCGPLAMKMPSGYVTATNST